MSVKQKAILELYRKSAEVDDPVAIEEELTRHINGGKLYGTYSDESIFVIAEALKIGACRKDAAHAAGIHSTTFHSWMKKGKDLNDPEHEKYLPFVVAVEKAEAECAISLTKRIYKAGEYDWKANRYMLECRSPEHTPFSQRADAAKQAEAMFDIAKKVLSTEQYADLLNAIANSGK